MGAAARALIVAAFLGGVGAHAQAPAAEPHPSCVAIAQSDAQLEPVSKLCEFALSYRHSLPDFICEQQTVSRANWFGGPPQRKIESQITYQNGTELHSNTRVNGVPAEDRAGATMTFRTEGEFGGELVDLFTPVIKPEFRFEKKTRVRGIEALEFSFHVPEAENRFWTVNDGRKTVRPEFRGSIWLQPGTAKLLRIEVEPLHLPKDFLMESALSHTDYSDVSLGEVGTHLLPIHAESRACLRTKTGRTGTVPECIINTIDFHGCRKFAGRARIVP